MSDCVGSICAPAPIKKPRRRDLVKWLLTKRKTTCCNKRRDCKDLDVIFMEYEWYEPIIEYHCKRKRGCNTDE